MTSSYPLKWPDGWERGQPRPSGKFKSTYDTSMRKFYYEMERLGADGVVISSNIPLRLDGRPRGDVARLRIEDPGVAIYFTLNGKQLAMARDAYDTVMDNFHSLVLCLEAMRAVERHGGNAMMEKAFDGFMALPDQANWRSVLGFTAGAEVTLPAAEDAYRRGAKLCHADAGGGHEAMVKLNAAIAQAREELGR